MTDSDDSEANAMGPAELDETREGFIDSLYDVSDIPPHVLNDFVHVY